MTLPLPLCASCRRPLAGAAERVVYQYTALQGRPQIGWHQLCAANDLLHARAAHRGEQRLDARELLALVAQRDPRCVSAGKAWRGGVA